MTDEELVNLERRFWHKAGDVEWYRAQTHESLLMAFPAPFGITDREAVLDAVASSGPWKDVVLDEVRVARPSANTAIIAYRASAGRDEPYRCYASSLFVQEGDAWKLAFHQQTPIDEGD